MGAYAWYDKDYSNDVSYWAYSYEYRTTEFATEVSRLTGNRITASDTSYAIRSADLEKHQRGINNIHMSVDAVKISSVVQDNKPALYDL